MSSTLIVWPGVLCDVGTEGPVADVVAVVVDRENLSNLFLILDDRVVLIGRLPLVLETTARPDEPRGAGGLNGVEER